MPKKQLPAVEKVKWKRRPDGGADIVVTAPLPGYDGWHVVATFDIGGDAAVLYKVTVEPASDAIPSSPLTATMLRAARLADVQREAERQLRDFAAEEATEEHGIRGFDELADAMVRRPGPVTQWTDIKLAKLARDYVRLCETSKTPLRSLAGRRHVSYGAARDAIKLARDRGWLQPTIRGRAGGQLTDKAIELLGGE